MALPILQIAKLLTQLAVLAPVASEGVDKIRRLVETIRRGDGNTLKQIEDLRRAIELQNSVNREMHDQLGIIKSVLDNVQKSLKIFALATAGVGVVATAALMVALWK